MALQQFVCVVSLIIVFISPTCRSQEVACGRTFVNRDKGPGRWPWHAAIDLGGFEFQGSLITNEWVLTTALVKDYIPLRVVRLGVYDRSSSDPNEVNRTVEAVICHGNFSKSSFENDLCLLKLSAPVSFTDYIQPICLPAANSTLPDGHKSFLTGFSQTEDSPKPAQTLQETEMQIVGNDECNDLSLYRDSFPCGYCEPRTATENMMCASKQGSHFMFYLDMGAPLVTKIDYSWVQSGILILVETRGFKDRPNLFTRMTRYQQWISDTVTGMKPGFVVLKCPDNLADSGSSCSSSKILSPPPVEISTTAAGPMDVVDSVMGGAPQLGPVAGLFALSLLALWLHA